MIFEGIFIVAKYRTLAAFSKSRGMVSQAVSWNQDQHFVTWMGWVTQKNLVLWLTYWLNIIWNGLPLPLLSKESLFLGE